MNYTENTSTRRALGVLIPLALLALLISALIISIANDIYAFVKPSEEIRIILSSPGSLDDFSMTLNDAGIIRNPTIFKLYVISKGKQQVIESFKGELLLNSNLSYRQILHHIQEEKSP